MRVTAASFHAVFQASCDINQSSEAVCFICLEGVSVWLKGLKLLENACFFRLVEAQILKSCCGLGTVGPMSRRSGRSSEGGHQEADK